MSCYDVIHNHNRFRKNRLQIEEDDVFKFNCEQILEHDFISLQLVIAASDMLKLYDNNDRERIE